MLADRKMTLRSSLGDLSQVGPAAPKAWTLPVLDNPVEFGAEMTREEAGNTSWVSLPVPRCSGLLGRWPWGAISSDRLVSFPLPEFFFSCAHCCCCDDPRPFSITAASQPGPFLPDQSSVLAAPLLSSPLFMKTFALLFLSLTLALAP